jgi:hypothetical protein
MAVPIASRKVVSKTRIIRRLILSGVFFLSSLQTVTFAQAHFDSKNVREQNTQSTAMFSLPSTYGKIIYRYNETSPNKVYIIGISHRDSRTRLNGSNTAKTQTEVYKIGEWLNHNRNLDLLLPEGFFNAPETQTKVRPLRLHQPLDDNTLEKTLADNSRFITAEMLLMQQFHMRACQIENQRLYDAVLNRIVKLEATHNDAATDLTLEMQINRLQEERTAAILQNIPKVIETEFHKGAIRNKNALFTIGLNHIATIISYLKNNKIQLQPPSHASSLNADCSTGVNFQNKGFGVIVIIPHTLVRDREIMKMTNLIGMI